MEWAMSTFRSHGVYIANFEVDTANSAALSSNVERRKIRCWSITMRFWTLLLTLALALAGCSKPEHVRVEIRPVRTVVVDPKPVLDGRQAVGEVRPRYESDLSFRVSGKLIARRVDIGAMVKQ